MCIRDSLFSRRIYVGEKDMIRRAQRLSQFMEKAFCPGVRMRLESDPQLFVRILFRGGQRRRNLGWMMGVVVDNDCPVVFALALKPPLRSFVFGKAALNGLCRNVKQGRQGKAGKRVFYIVLTNDLQCIALICLFPGPDESECAVAQLIIGDISRMEIGVRIIDGESQHAAGKTASNLVEIFNIRVYDQCPAFWQKFRKSAEAAADVSQVVKEIQMIFFYI